MWGEEASSAAAETRFQKPDAPVPVIHKTPNKLEPGPESTLPPTPPPRAPAQADPRAAAFSRVMGLAQQHSPDTVHIFTTQCQTYGGCMPDRNTAQAQVRFL